jgi:hypothetical protein
MSKAQAIGCDRGGRKLALEVGHGLVSKHVHDYLHQLVVFGDFG